MQDLKTLIKDSYPDIIAHNADSANFETPSGLVETSEGVGSANKSISKFAK